jgi:hypothetical protein
MNGQQVSTDPIPLTLAARSAGIPARTLRNWIASGKLAAIRGQRGWLVRVGDIAQIAAMIDNHAASEMMADGMAARLAAELAAPTAGDAGDAAMTASHAAITATPQSAQAEALVQQLLAPFIAEQTRLAEELGRVKAEREAQDATIAELRRRAALAEAELLRHRDEWALSRQRDVERAQAAPVAPGSTEDASPDDSSTESSPGFWARVRRVFGGV